MKKTLLAALLSSGAIAAPIDMALFQNYDANRDGFVNRVEVEGSVDLEGRFQDIDTDRDGRISEAEMRAWIANPDKDTQLRAAPVDRHQQWRDLERSREARREQAAQALLAQTQQGQAQPPREARRPVATQ